MTAVDQPGIKKSVPTDPARNLALELVRATEAAAINCARYMGFGDKNQVDGAAVDAMRPVLGSAVLPSTAGFILRRAHWASLRLKVSGKVGGNALISAGGVGRRPYAPAHRGANGRTSVTR